jgi:hypothetical protein
MTNDLVKRLRSTAKAGSLLPPYPEVINAAADRIEDLEYALRSKAINGSKCPICGTSGRTAYLYVGEKDERKKR